MCLPVLNPRSNCLVGGDREETRAGDRAANLLHRLSPKITLVPILNICAFPAPDFGKMFAQLRMKRRNEGDKCQCESTMYD